MKQKRGFFEQAERGSKIESYFLSAFGFAFLALLVFSTIVIWK